MAGSFLSTVVLHGALGMALSRELTTWETSVLFENVALGLALTALLLVPLSVVQSGTPRTALQAVALGLFADAVVSSFLIPFHL